MPLIRGCVRRGLVLGSAVMLLTSCAGSSKLPAACPSVAIAHDLKQATDFGREEQPVYSALVAAARMDSAIGDCHGDDGALVADIDITMRGIRGPALGGDEAELPYFAAVLNEQDKVIAKQNLSVTFALGKEGAIVDKTEKLRLTLPDAAKADTAHWRVLLGFQLSPEQLAFNRGEFGEPVPEASPAGKVWRRRTP